MIMERSFNFELKVCVFKMIFLGLSILLLNTNFAFSAKFCASQNPCRCVLANNSVIDLSSVGLPNYPRFYEVPSDCSTLEVYSYNPCFPFDSPDKHAVTKSGHTPCTKASACVKGPGSADGKPPEEHAIGLQRTAVFGFNKTHTYINYTVPGSNRVLQVLLNCNQSDSDVHELSFINPECNNTDTPIILQLTSKCACVDGCKSALPSPSSPGMSTGSKLLIAFFTILLAYFLIGFVWNYCNGAQGTELIPNVEFWNDLPTLIMEGVAFTCSCCGRQSTYGEV